MYSQEYNNYINIPIRILLSRELIKKIVPERI